MSEAQEKIVALCNGDDMRRIAAAGALLAFRRGVDSKTIADWAGCDEALVVRLLA
jgi:hypothetical protein